MSQININLISGELYKTINVDNLELTYLQIKELFNDLDDRFYKIINNYTIIYTNLYDLDYDKIILNDNLTIIFLDYDKDIINKLKIDSYSLVYLNDELRARFAEPSLRVAQSA